MAEYDINVMSDNKFKAFILEKFGKIDIAPEEMARVLGDFFEKNPEMLEKYPTKEMVAQLEKDREAAEIKSYLDANNISIDEYNGAPKDVKEWVAKEMAAEKEKDLKTFLESQNMTMEEYNAADNATKELLAKKMKDINDTELKTFLAENNISMEDYNSSNGDIKNWVNREMKQQKDLKSFLAANNMTMEEYKASDGNTKAWIEQEMQKQKAEKAAKFAKAHGKEVRPDDRPEITPKDVKEEIKPKDTSENEVKPDDVQRKESKNQDEEEMKTTEGQRKSGIKHADDADEPKGPFKEGDIINYMYNEWLIGLANWCYSKAGKKIKEWGTAAYIAYLDGRAQGRQKKEENKAKGKPHKTLDKYLETQDKAIKIKEKTTEILSKNIDDLGKVFAKLKEGKFEDLNFGLNPEEHAKLFETFNKSKEGKLNAEERKGLSPKLESKLQLLEKFNDLKNGKIHEEDLKRLSPEKRNALLKDLHETKNNPLAKFCEDTQKAFKNMNKNFNIVSQIAANYTAAKLGDAMARDKDFNEGDKAAKDLEVVYMKETMLTIFSRLDDIAERGGNPQVFLEELAKYSEKAKKKTDREINNNIVMEHNNRPLSNSYLKSFEEHLRNPEAEERSKGKVSMYETLYQGYLTEETKSKIIENLAKSRLGIEIKEDTHNERANNISDRIKTIKQKNITPNDSTTEQRTKSNDNNVITQQIINNKIGNTK